MLQSNIKKQTVKEDKMFSNLKRIIKEERKKKPTNSMFITPIPAPPTSFFTLYEPLFHCGFFYHIQVFPLPSPIFKPYAFTCSKKEEDKMFLNIKRTNTTK